VVFNESLGKKDGIGMGQGGVYRGINIMGGAYGSKRTKLGRSAVSITWREKKKKKKKKKKNTQKKKK